jgi:hypothetical protein
MQKRFGSSGRQLLPSMHAKHSRQRHSSDGLPWTLLLIVVLSSYGVWQTRSSSNKERVGELLPRQGGIKRNTKAPRHLLEEEELLQQPVQPENAAPAVDPIYRTFDPHLHQAYLDLPPLPPINASTIMVRSSVQTP